MAASLTVVAATDFSASARFAVDRAAGLAAEQGAVLVLVHILPKAAWASLRDWLGAESLPVSQVFAAVTERLRELAVELGAAHRIEVKTRLSEGSVAAELLRCIRSVAPELTVVGAQGEASLRQLLLGTTSERLLQQAMSPLLVVREAPRATYRRVLVAVDFSAWSLPALLAARRWAPTARLVLLHAYRLPYREPLRAAGLAQEALAVRQQAVREQSLLQLHALAERAGLRSSAYEVCAEEGDAAALIQDLQGSRELDLVVLGKQGHPDAEFAWLGGTARRVLAVGKLDLLLVPQPE